ncbi:hypothetical protein PCANC_07393 [Puccinia coronata f. sp. avenae]|uniref:Uncharacterized protein n=1 Tax=Puccinia coronata f. sp. avenae TaxID=200324 RepID=A0A2N5T587_9BASI|nr:hypothetical protein PCANC_07393 [Puccinia coronata f. sp. avenae]
MKGVSELWHELTPMEKASYKDGVPTSTQSIDSRAEHASRGTSHNSAHQEAEGEAHNGFEDVPSDDDNDVNLRNPVSL